MRREDERLKDILATISAIERYANQERLAFDEQELIQVWMIHHLQISKLLVRQQMQYQPKD